MTTELNQFRGYFTAYQNQLQFGISFTYGILPNCIVFPANIEFAEAVFQYMHEETHAQLANTPLGLTMQTVEKLAGKVQEAVFTLLRPALDLTKESSQELFRQLFLYGRMLEDGELHPLPKKAVDAFVALEKHPSFSKTRALFERLLRRHAAIWGRWRPVQEGLAILSSIQIAKGESDAALGFLRRAIRAAASITGRVSKHELRLSLRQIADRTEKHYENLPPIGAWPDSATQGFLMAREALSQTDSMAMVWFSALLASHFPYHRCRLIDMDDAEFSRQTSHGYLNPWLRFVKLVQNSAVVKNASNSLADANEILAFLDSENTLPPLTDEAKYFRPWERDFLWGSDNMTEFLGVRFDKQLAPEHLAFFNALREDKRNDPRMWARNSPTVVQENGEVISIDAAQKTAFVSNFMHWYDVHRTSTLLKTFDRAAKGDKF